MNPPDQCQKWFDAGVSEFRQFRPAWLRARCHAIAAGFFFLKARAVCPHGQWASFLDDHTTQIKPRTVQFFIQLSEAALEWTRAQRPELPPSKLEAAACTEIMLMSPKPLIALLRELRELRPFGEYDSVKYAIKKRQTPGQIEFSFAVLTSTLDVFLHLDAANYHFIPPENKTEGEALADLKARLETALEKVEARLAETQAIPI